MIRKLGYHVIRLILLIRNYGFGCGFRIWLQIINPFSKIICIKSILFKNPIFLRKNDSDLDIFDQIFIEKQYEWFQIKELNPKVIVDAGSNIGLAALFFSFIFPECAIYCIEPDSENLNLLKRNTQNYPNITILQGAIWNKSELLSLMNPEGYSAGFTYDSSTETQGVRGYTMDEIISMYSINKIHILKLDIEGAEKEVFESENLGWMNQTEIIVIELHDMYKPNTSQPFIKAINGKIKKMFFKGENIICYLNHSHS